MVMRAATPFCRFFDKGNYGEFLIFSGAARETGKTSPAADERLSSKAGRPTTEIWIF